MRQAGGGCSSCMGGPGSWMQGGYKATRRNRQLLRKYKQGKSIGFTAKASLKAKGLIPRSNGQYKLGPKYSRTGKTQILTGYLKAPRLTRRR